MKDFLLVAVLTVWVAWTINQKGSLVETDSDHGRRFETGVFAVVLVITIALTIGVAAIYGWVI